MLRKKAGGRVHLRHFTGFSLVEMMFCVGLLAVVILFIVALFTRMLNAATKGGDLSVAAYLATAELDKVTYDTPLLKTIAGTSNFQEAPFITGGQASLNKTDFYIYDNAAAMSSVHANPATNLYHLDVEIQWYARENQGTAVLHTLHLDRLVYIEQ